MTAHSRWLIKDSESTEQLLDQFRQKFTLEPMQIRHETLSFYDDFEWHLWRKNQLLASNNQGLVLTVDTSGLSFFDREKTPVFAKDFNNAPLKDALIRLTKGRRLFPMAELEVEFCQYAVRNKDLKKVCDLNIILTGYGTMVELKGLRGYEKVFRRCKGIILNERPKALEQHIFFSSLKLLGIQPSDYSARPKFKLAAELDSCDATALIAQKLWHNVRVNEEGIIRDWDAQFLHQYRVALRRMRALFSQMKQSLGQEESQWFKTHLAGLAAPTHRQRDLDVYLRSESDYLALIPSGFHEGLKTLFKDLALERQQVQRTLAATLKSQEYKDSVSQIESHLALCPQSPTKKGHKPTLKVAARQIIRRYNAISIDALEITDTSPDEQVHDVRLGCKKLRYLLEFFNELFPKKQIRPLLKALKRLQDNLGAFNDLSVQRESLEHYLEQNPATPETEAAVHALSGVLYNRQQQERGRVQSQLENFLSEPVRQSVESLMPKPAPSETQTGRLSE